MKSGLVRFVRWKDKDELELRAPLASPRHQPIDWELFVTHRLLKYNDFWNKKCNFGIKI